MWVFVAMKFGHGSKAKSPFFLCVTPMKKIPTTGLVPYKAGLWKVATIWEKSHRKQVTSYQSTVDGYRRKSSLFRRDEVVINSLSLICGQVQTNLSARHAVPTHCQAHSVECTDYGRTLSDASMLYFADVFYLFLCAP